MARLPVLQPFARYPARPYTAFGMRMPSSRARRSSLGGPCPVTSLPTVTQKLRRLFLRPKISRYRPAGGGSTAGGAGRQRGRPREGQIRKGAGRHSRSALRATSCAPAAPCSLCRPGSAADCNSPKASEPLVQPMRPAALTIGHQLLNQLVNLLGLLALPSPLAAARIKKQTGTWHHSMMHTISTGAYPAIGSVRCAGPPQLAPARGPRPACPPLPVDDVGANAAAHAGRVLPLAGHQADLQGGGRLRHGGRHVAACMHRRVWLAKGGPAGPWARRPAGCRGRVRSTHPAPAEGNSEVPLLVGSGA